MSGLNGIVCECITDCNCLTKKLQGFKRLQSQNTELKALVSELVEACESYIAIEDKFKQYPKKNTASRQVLSKNKELIEAIKGDV